MVAQVTLAPLAVPCLKPRCKCATHDYHTHDGIATFVVPQVPLALSTLPCQLFPRSNQAPPPPHPSYCNTSSEFYPATYTLEARDSNTSACQPANTNGAIPAPLDSVHANRFSSGGPQQALECSSMQNQASVGDQPPSNNHLQYSTGHWVDSKAAGEDREGLPEGAAQAKASTSTPADSEDNELEVVLASRSFAGRSFTRKGGVARSKSYTSNILKARAALLSGQEAPDAVEDAGDEPMFVSRRQHSCFNFAGPSPPSSAAGVMGQPQQPSMSAANSLMAPGRGPLHHAQVCDCG